ncbi:MAG: hypothetical protein Q9160_007683 [Pyrenula sp. 1 TL-2023]
MDASPTNSSSAQSLHAIKKVWSRGKRGSAPKSESTGDLTLQSSISSQADRSPNRNSEESSRAESSKSSGSGIAKLIPGHSKRKRRRRRESELKQLADQEELQRGRKGLEPGQERLQPASPLNQSSSSLNNDGASSLLTDDSEPDVSRPELTSRDSHAGYLTTSSPLITTTAVNEARTPPPSDPLNSDQTSSATLDNTNFDVDRPSTAPLPTLSEAAADLPHTHRADTLGVPGSSSRRSSINAGRGISPRQKLRESFTLQPNKSPGNSPDRNTDTNGTRGSFLNGTKKSSLSAKRKARISADLPPVSPVPSAINTEFSTRFKSANASLPSLDTSKRPVTPPGSAIKAPLTTVTPPTPTDPKSTIPKTSPKKDVNAYEDAPNIVVSLSGNMISHRRARSTSAVGQPSKLSNAISAPLTPTVEEARTPGSKASSRDITPAAGFFSSWGLQNAASFLTNTLNSQSRSRSGTGSTEPEKIKEPERETTELVEPIPSEKTESAIDTLGQGSLNFSHLGLNMNGPEENGTEPPPSQPDAAKPSANQRDEQAARMEDARAARAVSMAYEKPFRENGSTPIAEDAPSNPTPRHSQQALSGAFAANGDQTPPNGSIFEEDTGSIKRSSSIRSKMTSKRNRGSSGATGNSALAAMIGASTSTLANPATGPRLTGFAVAPKSRNRNFHQLFRSVPEDDYLIEDYSCALQRDILLAGRLYISEGHICFSSNILGWVTTLVISFDEIVSVEKETTAMVFPNAIAVQTLHARHTFRSLLSREATYDLIIGIWKASHPGTFKSSANGIQIDRGTGDKTEKTMDNEIETDVASDEDDEVYDEDAEEDEADSFVDTGEGSVADSDTSNIKSVSRKTSAITGQANNVPYPSSAGDVAQGEKVAAAAAELTVDFPGPQSHAPTDCTDSTTHYDRIIKDETIPAPLGKIYSMLFGPMSGIFVPRYLRDEQKVMDLQFEDDKKGLSNEVKSRSYSYIKPLNAPIGPKQTKCTTTEQIDFLDLEKAVSVTWPIEKGAVDGQTTYGVDLVKVLKAGVSNRPRAHTGASRSLAKGKKKKKTAGSAPLQSSIETAASQPESWGLFEPLRGTLGPVVDIFRPLITAQVVILLLILTIVYMWLRGPSRRDINGAGEVHISHAERLVAYEAMWRKEESELWGWLEDRIGFDTIILEEKASSGKGVKTKTKEKQKHQALKERQKILKGKDVEVKLREEKMGQREMENMVRIADERLDVLKSVLDRRKTNDEADLDNTEKGKDL